MLRKLGESTRNQAARSRGRVECNAYARAKVHSSSGNTWSYAKRAGWRNLQHTATFVAGSAVLAYSYISAQPVLNDASLNVADEKSEVEPGSATINPLLNSEHLTTIAWGSNRSNLINPAAPNVETIRDPSSVTWLEDVALRDLALHERHGACVDARGDIYQWGDAHVGQNAAERGPTLSLKGKDIVSIQVTPSRVIALSSSGKVYVLPATKESQKGGSQAPSSPWSFFTWFSGGNEEMKFVELKTEGRLGRGEKFISISAGNEHLLALTSNGRTFAHPLSKDANSHGQLGFRKFSLPTSGSGAEDRVSVELVPKSVADPFAKTSPNKRTQRSLLDETPWNVVPPQIPPKPALESVPELQDKSIKFCDRLFEIPSLHGIKIVQAVAGARSSFVRTEGEGRVLAWGANEFGQLGLGSTLTVDTITVPTEVVFSRSASSRTRSNCIDIRTGGDLTFFTVERSDGTSITSTDLLACGMGQYGGLGNGLYSTAQGDPKRIKAVSGLVEFSEATQNLQAVIPYALSASPTGHVLLTMDTLSRAGPGVPHGGGRDLLVWGANRDYQLGNSKRASLATPTTLELPGLPHSVKLDGDEKGKGRLMLMTRRAKVVKDLQGQKWKSDVDVEQCAFAGWNSSLVYWRICKS